ncbi:MAG: hypothetical protein HGB04_01715 [Chlorobiaceae bacterium]|nr:hypothetical protein [Chlorobiaceae bacterium]
MTNPEVRAVESLSKGTATEIKIEARGTTVGLDVDKIREIVLIYGEKTSVVVFWHAGIDVHCFFDEYDQAVDIYNAAVSVKSRTIGSTK